jgi:hypothetical protein
LGLLRGKVHSGKCTELMPFEWVLKVKKWKKVEELRRATLREFLKEKQTK